MNTLQTYKVNPHTKISVRVKGMHCASCASIIERTVKKIDGVEHIEVNPGTENAKISFDNTKTNPEDFNKKLESLGYSLMLPKEKIKNNKLDELYNQKIKVISAIPLAV